MRALRHVIPSLAVKGDLVVDEGQLKRWGEDLGASTSPPLVISLTGELGTGKTTLAKAICAGYGVTESVTSPTYAIVHRYSASLSAVFHIDLYRLDDASQLTNIGWDELLTEHALVIVEWPERAGNRLPGHHLHIELDYVPGDPEKRVLLAG